MTDGAEVVVVADCGSQSVNKFDYNKLKDRNYKGDDYNVDSALSQGPVQNRKCTDCLFLIIWISFLIGMMAMTIDGYVNGNGPIMLAPISGGSQICGFTVGTEGFPYLYVPDLSDSVESPSEFFTNGFCATNCPTSSDLSVTCAPYPPTSNYPDGYNGCTASTGELYTTDEIMNYCIPTTASI